MRVLQINTSVNTGSTGRIVEEIGKKLILTGNKSYIAFGRKERTSFSTKVKIGNNVGQSLHLFKSRIFDLHGFGSTKATREFVKEMDEIKPDLIHLHNLHGYYLNIEVLFDYLTKKSTPIVWTFHDCWPFTGHCSYFDKEKCEKWQSICYKCTNLSGYPQSWLRDNSKKNFQKKRELFTSVENLVIVSPSFWLSNHIQKSFLKKYDVRVINNGVDLDAFKPLKEEGVHHKYSIVGKKIVLGVAGTWDKRKGLNDFLKLRKNLDYSIEIILVGLSKKQIRELPSGIIGILRTENQNELAELYSSADVFVNPTYIDNFPTTNIESLGCGTPVITYDTGGSPEAIDEKTGIVVKKGNLSSLLNAIQVIIAKPKADYSVACRQRAEKHFDQNMRHMDYILLYKNLIERKY